MGCQILSDHATCAQIFRFRMVNIFAFSHFPCAGVWGIYMVRIAFCNALWIASVSRNLDSFAAFHICLVVIIVDAPANRDCPNQRLHWQVAALDSIPACYIYLVVHHHLHRPSSFTVIIHHQIFFYYLLGSSLLQPYCRLFCCILGRMNICRRI